MEKEIDITLKQFKTIEPDDSIKVAKMQSKINVLTKFKDMPKRHFNKKK